jgi:hypothetical protein
MSNNEASMIANTILDQIGRRLGGTLSCIGAHQFQAIPRNDAAGILGGVTFKINPNPKVRVHSRVTVTLDASDTYKVNITTCRGKVVLDASNVYNEDLAGPSGIIERTVG